MEELGQQIDEGKAGFGLFKLIEEAEGNMIRDEFSALVVIFLFFVAEKLRSYMWRLLCHMF